MSPRLSTAESKGRPLRRERPPLLLVRTGSGGRCDVGVAVVAGAAAAAALGLALGLDRPVLALAVLGVAVGAAAQAGDLAESLLKRSLGVKDMGRLFPGHGGALDRLDSVLFAAPVVYYAARWFFGAS